MNFHIWCPTLPDQHKDITLTPIDFEAAVSLFESLWLATDYRHSHHGWKPVYDLVSEFVSDRVHIDQSRVSSRTRSKRLIERGDIGLLIRPAFDSVNLRKYLQPEDLEFFMVTVQIVDYIPS